MAQEFFPSLSGSSGGGAREFLPSGFTGVTPKVTPEKEEFSPFQIAMMGGDPSIMGADTFRNVVRPIDIAASTVHQLAMPIVSIPAQVIATIIGGLNPGTTGKIEREVVNQTIDAMTLKPGDVESVIRSIAGMPPVQDYTPEQGIGPITTAWKRTPRGEGPAAAQGSEAINKVLEAVMPSTYVHKGFEKLREAGKLSSGDEGLEGIIPGSPPSALPTADMPKWALATIDQAEFWTGLTADLSTFALLHKTGTTLNRSFKNYVSRRAKGTNTIEDISRMLDKLEKAKVEVPIESLDAKTGQTFFELEAALRADKGRLLNNAEQKTADAKRRELGAELNRGVPKERAKPSVPEIEVEGKTIAPVKVKPEPVIKPSGGPKTGPGIAKRMSKELGIKIKYDGMADNTEYGLGKQYNFTADLGDGNFPSFSIIDNLSLDAATSALDPVLKGFLGKEEVKPVESIKPKLEVIEGGKPDLSDVGLEKEFRTLQSEESSILNKYPELESRDRGLLHPKDTSKIDNIPLETLKRLDEVHDRMSEIAKIDYDRIDERAPFLGEKDIWSEIDTPTEGEIKRSKLKSIEGGKVETPDPVIKNSSKPPAEPLVEDLPKGSTVWPALKAEGKTYAGKPGDTHADIGIKHNLLSNKSIDEFDVETGRPWLEAGWINSKGDFIRSIEMLGPKGDKFIEDTIPTFKTLDDATLGGFEVRTNRSFKTKEAAQKFVNKIFEREQKGETTKGIEPGVPLEPILVNGKYRVGEAIDLIGEELAFAKMFPDQSTAKSRAAFEQLVQEEAGKAVEKFQFSGVEEMTSRLEELQAPVVEWLKNPEGKIVDPLENEIRAIGWELPKDHYMQQGIDRILEAINKKKSELGIEEKVEFDATGEGVTGEDILLEFDKLTPEELKALDPNTEVGASLRSLFGEETGTGPEISGMFDKMKWTKESVKDFKNIFDFVKNEKGSISFEKDKKYRYGERIVTLTGEKRKVGPHEMHQYFAEYTKEDLLEFKKAWGGEERAASDTGQYGWAPEAGLKSLEGERGSFSIRDLPEEKIKQMKKIVDEAGADLIGFLKTKGFDEKAAKAFADAAEQLKEVKSATPFADKLRALYPENDFATGENTRKGKPRKFVANDKEYIVRQTPVWEGERTALMEANELPGTLIREMTKSLENPIRTFGKISPAIDRILRVEYQAAEKAKVHQKKVELTALKKATKDFTRKEKDNLAKFWFNEQRDGARMLESMGIKAEDIPKTLTERELKLRNILTKGGEGVTGFDPFWDIGNDSRVQFGRRPMNYTSNYLTFAREIGLAERLGLKTDFVLSDRKTISERTQAKSTVFKPALSRFTDKVFPLKLDPVEIYANYAQGMIDHINMSPVISKAAALREPLFDPKTGKRFLLKNEKPNTDSFIQNWSNAIAGVEVAKLPTLVDRGMRALNRNLTFAVLSANLRSALIQPSALRNTYAMIGERHLAQGIIDTLSPEKRKFAYENANVLETAAYDQAIVDGFKAISGATIVGKAQRGVAKAGLWPLKILDYEARMITWNGGYSFGKANGLSKGQAIRFADDLVTRTQASGLVGDVAPIQRNTLGKFFTLFQTFTINDFGFLTQDVLGISKGGLNKRNFAMATRYIIATTAMNSLYEDVLGIKSPFSTPYTALREGLEDNDSIAKIMGKVAMEFAEVIPPFGGAARYGSDPLGPGAQLLGEVFQKFTDAPMQKPGLELAGKVAGITGTAQIGKVLRAKKRGESLWGQLMGTYTKNQGGGSGRRRRGTSSGFSRGF